MGIATKVDGVKLLGFVPAWNSASAWRRFRIPSVSGFESSRRLLKWLIVGTAIGLVAGAGAVLFTSAIQFVTKWVLQGATGFRPPAPIGEGGTPLVPMARAWLLPIVTALGGLASGILVFGLAPEAEGHGTDAAIEAFHKRGGWIRPRIPPVKLLASAITIGSGGSAGREGPAAQISAGFGAILGHAVFKNPQDRRIAVAAGIGSGIGAIFRAPLGGALLAAEILYLHDMEVEAIIPSLIASIVGYTLYGAFFGFHPIFGDHPALGLGSPIQLVYYGMLGVVSGAGGILYAKTFYGMTDWFRKLRLPRWIRPALGGLLVGLLGLVLPQVLHTGYGWVQLIMTKEGLLTLSPWVLLAIPFGKIVATSLSIGSGGSGGIFGPGMVIGGTLGAVLWRIGSTVLPGMPPGPGPFVIVGMMALFGGVAHAPLAVMLMVAEMTGTLSLLAPAMIAVAISTAIVGDVTIYHAQLRDRASSTFHRARWALPFLSVLRVDDISEPAPLTLRGSMPIGEALARLLTLHATRVAVTTDDGQVIGAVSRERLRRVPAEERTAPLSTVAVRMLLRPDQTIEEGVQVLSDSGADTLPVIKDGGDVRLVTARGIMRAYREAMASGARRKRSETAERETR